MDTAERARATKRPRQETPAPLRYQSGFGNEFATEAVRGALPHGQNSPQKVPYGLYAEQLSGTAFTAPRARESPLVALPDAPCRCPRAFRPFEAPRLQAARRSTRCRCHPSSCAGTRCRCLRRRPISSTALLTMAGNGDAAMQAGMASTSTRATARCTTAFFYDADGELLIVPQQGALRIATELGVLDVAPGEIAVVPRGVTLPRRAPRRPRRAATSARTTARCCACPSWGRSAPTASPIPRDFRRPVAAFEDRDGDFELVAKFDGRSVDAPTRSLAARRRRLARQPRALQVRPRALQHDRHGELRPPGSVDLHGADRRRPTRRAPPTSTS